jgi:hypothetical protein
MATFIVVTQESVQGRYSVEAATKAEAQAKFDRHGPCLIDWDGVTQTDYMADKIDVEDIYPLT